jgi:hypothetical protein
MHMSSITSPIFLVIVVFQELGNVKNYEPSQGGEFSSGLTLVYSPPAEQNAAANVVLVHGLFGHPWKTWADETAKHPEKSFWPKILLPEVIPDARIYSFGYDADIGRFMSAAGLNTVFQHGTNLLGSLADLVEETVRVYGFARHDTRRSNPIPELSANTLRRPQPWWTCLERGTMNHFSCLHHVSM